MRKKGGGTTSPSVPSSLEINSFSHSRLSSCKTQEIAAKQRVINCAARADEWRDGKRVGERGREGGKEEEGSERPRDRDADSKEAGGGSERLTGAAAAVGSLQQLLLPSPSPSHSLVAVAAAAAAAGERENGCSDRTSAPSLPLIPAPRASLSLVPPSSSPPLAHQHRGNSITGISLLIPAAAAAAAAPTPSSSGSRET